MIRESQPRQPVGRFAVCEGTAQLAIDGLEPLPLTGDEELLELDGKILKRIPVALNWWTDWEFTIYVLDRPSSRASRWAASPSATARRSSR